MKNRGFKGFWTFFMIIGLLAMPMLASAKETVQQWELVNPAGVIKITPIKMPPRISTLEGKTIGLKWNMKPGGNIFLDRVAELLKEKVPSAKIIKFYEVEPTTVPQSANMDVADQKARIIAKYKPDIVIGSQCDWGSCTSWLVGDQLAVEKLGIPTVTISTSEFIGLAKNTMESFGSPDMAFVIVPHPLGMIPRDEVIAKANAAFPAILKAATEWKPSRTTIPGLGKAPYPLEVIKFKGTYADVNKMFFEKGWSLGLPIIPPTKEAVQRMLKGTTHKPSEVVWDAIPPRNGVVTVELVAATGVMAGCKPEHMPLLLAIVEAMKTTPKAGREWRALTTTTHPTAPLIIVSGPIVKELGIGYGTGAMGPEMPVNNAVGYFVNLLGDVAGGSRPPPGDMSTHGWVGNIIATVAGENVDDNPWKESWPVERGFKPMDNVVIYAGGMPVNQNDHASVDPKDLAEVMAYTMNGIGVSRCFQDGGVWILGPEHAATLASKGWSKKDIREFLYKTARAPFWAQPPMIEGKCVTTACCPPESFGPVGPDTMLPICKSPDQIELVVVGGPGKQSQWWTFMEFSPFPPVMVKVDPWK